MLRHSARLRFPLMGALIVMALLVRASIPAGFMPAADGTLSLQICGSGLFLPATPDPVTGHHVTHGDNCPFGHSLPAGPLTEAAAIASGWMLVVHRTVLPRNRHAMARFLARAHRPRGPPEFP